MNYELAKKLKDAGFPQDTKFKLHRNNGKGEYFEWTDMEINEYDWIREDTIACPSLAELVAACGELTIEGERVFLSLENVDVRTAHESNRPHIEEHGPWHAVAQVCGTCAAEADAKSPEEAVARLWLALNAPKSP